MNFVLPSKKYLFVVTVVLTTAFSVNAQKKKIEKPATAETADNSIYSAVETRPEFPGGMKEFYAYIGGNYKIPNAMPDSISGKIITQFVIEKDGTITDIKVLKDLGFGTGDEAIRILKSSPKWKPGIQNGKPVRVLYALPIAIKPEPRKK